jgi:hypothetical protein
LATLRVVDHALPVFLFKVHGEGPSRPSFGAILDGLERPSYVSNKELNRVAFRQRFKHSQGENEAKTRHANPSTPRKKAIYPGNPLVETRRREFGTWFANRVTIGSL